MVQAVLLEPGPDGLPGESAAQTEYIKLRCGPCGRRQVLEGHLHREDFPEGSAVGGIITITIGCQRSGACDPLRSMGERDGPAQEIYRFQSHPFQYFCTQDQDVRSGDRGSVRVRAVCRPVHKSVDKWRFVSQRPGGAVTCRKRGIQWAFVRLPFPYVPRSGMTAVEASGLESSLVAAGCWTRLGGLWSLCGPDQSRFSAEGWLHTPVLRVTARNGFRSSHGKGQSAKIWTQDSSGRSLPVSPAVVLINWFFRCAAAGDHDNDLHRMQAMEMSWPDCLAQVPNPPARRGRRRTSRPESRPGICRHRRHCIRPSGGLFEFCQLIWARRCRWRRSRCLSRRPCLAGPPH